MTRKEKVVQEAVAVPRSSSWSPWPPLAGGEFTKGGKCHS